MFRIFKSKIFSLYFLLFLLLVLPAIFPLFHKGFFVTDDAEWMIIRLSAFYQALADGQFPVRFLGRLNHEYGYPVATFLYPGFMYLGSVIHMVGIGFVDTVKVILGLSMVSSFLFCFLWLRKLFDRFPSVIGALFYLYAPYHLYDLYVRGSVGELLALSIAPFILWQLERKSLFWSAIGIGFLILSHNSLAALFLPIIILYMVLGKSTKTSMPFYRLVAPLILGVGLSTFYWLPVLTELGNTVFSQTKVSDWRGYFAESSLIGYSSFLVLVPSVIFICMKKVKQQKKMLVFLFFILGILSIFLSHSVSSFMWHILPSGFIQFPFRMLSVTILSAAFLCAFIISSLRGVAKKVFIITLLLLLVQSTLKTYNNLEYIDKGEGFYTTNSATTTVMDEYMPLWVAQKPSSRPVEKVEITKGKGQIKELVFDNKKIAFVADIHEDAGIVRINTIYWPGWNTYRNGMRIDPSYNNAKGVIELPLSPGIWQIRAEFGETPLRIVSDIISIVSFCLLLFVIISKRNTYQKTK